MTLEIRKPDVDRIREAYEQCQGKWTGCDWTAQHGSTEINLDGEDAARLRMLADALEAGTISDDDYDSLPQPDSIENMQLYHLDEDEAYAERRRLWIDDLRSGADWLDEVASDASSAEECGREAMEYVEAGDIAAALEAAKRACCFESTYGDSPTWTPLREAIAELLTP